MTLHVNNLNIATAAQVKISGSCVIVADGTVTIQNNGSGFEILSGASLSVYHTGQLQIKSGAINTIDGSDMSRLKFLNAGTSQVQIQDNSSTQGMIISPNASVLMHAGFQLYGAIQAQSITIQDNNTALHEDLHLSGGGSSSSPTPDSWNRIVN